MLFEKLGICIILAVFINQNGFLLMRKPSMKRRVFCFFCGLALCGLGAAVSTRAGLGASPISSIPYVLTFVLPLSFGVWTILFNVLFVIGQIAILRRDFRKIQLLQLAAVAVFGVFIDLGMFLSGFFSPQAYWAQIAELLIGCMILAVGVSCQLLSDVMYIPGEGFVKTLCSKYKKDFGLVKISLDTSLVICAIIVSLLATAQVSGLREGTIIAALCLGAFVKFLLGRMRFVKMWFYGS